MDMSDIQRELNEISILSRFEYMEKYHEFDTQEKMILINQAIELYKNMLLRIDFNESGLNKTAQELNKQRTIRNKIQKIIKCKEELNNNLSYFGYNDNDKFSDKFNYNYAKNITDHVDHLYKNIHKIDEDIIKFCNMTI
jgi:hypothetical protein